MKNKINYSALYIQMTLPINKLKNKKEMVT